MNNLHLSGLTRNNWIISAILLVGILIFMQLYLLSNMGTKGQELNDIRTKQSNLKIENEILKAKILELRSNKVVLEGLAGDDKLKQKDLKLIDPDALSISFLFRIPSTWPSWTDFTPISLGGRCPRTAVTI